MARRYSFEEQSIIIDEVSMHQTNIKKGLMIAAERTGRSYNAVHQYWYNVLSKKEPCFLTAASDTTAVNRKVIRPDSWDSKKGHSCKLFKKILKWFKF